MKRSVRARCLRAAMALAIGGSAFQLSSCDPTVRATLLGGLESTTQGLASSLISAFFIGLGSGNDGTT
ncbi:MAG: hypothetical protein ACE5EX_05330, partial [Phycisphaerae bacterium]